MTPNTIICGDCRIALADMPAIFNCCISSPPYWSLRDYGLEPSIWDGDEKCGHKFDLSAPPRRNRKEADVVDKASKEATNKGSPYDARNTQFCSLCGAWKGCLGLEPTPELFIKHLCDIYDQVKRVMRKDGTVWVNLGDSYGCGKGQSGQANPEKQAARFADGKSINRDYHQLGGQGKTRPSDANIGIPAKSLVGIPEMFVLEMQRRGWIRRATNIWVKGLSFCENYSGSCMPDSAKDRPNKNGFEYIYLFTKSNDTSYWVHLRKCRIAGRKPKPDYIYIHKNTQQEYDYRPPIKSRKLFKKLWTRRNLWEGRDYWFEMQYEEMGESNAERPRMGQGQQTIYKQKRGDSKVCGFREVPPGQSPHSAKDKMRSEFGSPLGRQFRNVWLINPQPCKEAHFATFPEKLVEICLKAGCPEFVCTKCGKARGKVYEQGKLIAGRKQDAQYAKNALDKDLRTVRDKGWNTEDKFCPGMSYEQNFKGYTDCGCNADWRPGLVLDMFRWLWDCRSGSCKNAA